MQIQDVVAGMQQMLQYIEESQSMMSNAREQQQEDVNSNEHRAEIAHAAVSDQIIPDGAIMGSLQDLTGADPANH